MVGGRTLGSTLMIAVWVRRNGRALVLRVIVLMGVIVVPWLGYLMLVEQEQSPPPAVSYGQIETQTDSGR